MSEIATARMSSKGQVVIPGEIRKRLGLKPGSQFIVIGDKDTLILKTITPPSFGEFSELLAEARKQAKNAGLQKADIDRAIAKVRQGK